MEATPEVYRDDIARTTEAIRNLERSPMTETDAILHARLVRQRANLEHNLARADALWAEAQAQGAGTRLP